MCKSILIVGLLIPAALRAADWPQWRGELVCLEASTVEALAQALWQVNTTPWPAELVGTDDARTRALRLLQRDHTQSGKLAPLCQRISSGFCQEYETFLRAVLEKNPHQDVQASACLGLAHYLSNRIQRIDLVRQQPELGVEFAGLFGKEYLEELMHRDRTQASQEADALFERAVKEYGDVNMPGGGSVGERAKAELFEIRHLVVGRQAPDIEGQDQDGSQFKLDDYRGQVVLLDFWTEY